MRKGGREGKRTPIHWFTVQMPAKGKVRPRPSKPACLRPADLSHHGHLPASTLSGSSSQEPSPSPAIANLGLLTAWLNSQPTNAH